MSAEADTGGPSLGVITWHGEGGTLRHVVDSAAPEADQPAVLRTFSSRNGTRDDARRLVRGIVELIQSTETERNQQPELTSHARSSSS
jgi:hypothetical protein